jgi:hypothetical protein
VDDADELARELTVPEMPITRSDVLRMALVKGLAIMRAPSRLASRSTAWKAAE